MKSRTPQGEWECDTCGLALDEDATFCPSCSSSSSEEGWLECPKCGGGVISTDTQCPYCGIAFAGGGDGSTEDVYTDSIQTKSLSKKVKLENILETWKAHIPGMADKYDDFFREVISEFEKKETGLQAEWVKVGSLIGSKRTMMRINWSRYNCYIGAIPFGTDLLCTWDLNDPKNTAFGVAIDMSRDNKASGFFKSDFNETNELKAFAAVCLHCARIAAEKIFDDNNLDKSEFKKESSGVLGPL